MRKRKQLGSSTQKTRAKSKKSPRKLPEPLGILESYMSIQTFHHGILFLHRLSPEDPWNSPYETSQLWVNIWGSQTENMLIEEIQAISQANIGSGIES